MWIYRSCRRDICFVKINLPAAAEFEASAAQTPGRLLVGVPWLTADPENPRVFSYAPAGASGEWRFSPGLTPRAKLCRPCRGWEPGFRIGSKLGNWIVNAQGNRSGCHRPR